MDNGCTSVQLMNEEIADVIRIVADNIEIFGKVETFDEVVDHERADRKTKERIKTCLNVENEAACNSDQDICHEKCLADIKTAVFLEDHCHDISTAAGRTDVKKDRRAECRKRNGKAELQHGLVCQRMIHRTYTLKKRKSHGKQDTAVGSFGCKFTSEYYEPESQKKHVYDKGKVTGGNACLFGNEDCQTGDASKGKVVGKLKKISADCHDQGTSCQQRKVFEFFLHILSYPSINKYDLTVL